jgi:hypothetical protein
MESILTAVGAAVLAGIAATFAVGMVKTLKEGAQAFDEFNRAGFTLKAFFLGRVPKSNAGSSLQFGESAEITVTDGAVQATTTRTIAKTLS